MAQPKMFREDLKKSKPTTISEYIAAAPKEGRAKLRQMRACIKKAAPKSTEAIKWGAAAFSYKRILVVFTGNKKHIGFMPTPSVLKAFKKELAKYKTGKGSVQFPYDEPLPLALITRMTKARVKESLTQDKRWM